MSTTDVQPTTIKAITLTQPWATLVAIGAKSIETRSWGTNYRGPLAIHAAKGFPGWARDFATEDERASAILRQRGLVTIGEDWTIHLPLGKVIATAMLRDCIRIGTGTVALMGLSAQERAFGDFTPGRYAWVLTDIIAHPEPIPARGSLGLWDWARGAA